MKKILLGVLLGYFLNIASQEVNDYVTDEVWTQCILSEPPDSPMFWASECLGNNKFVKILRVLTYRPYLNEKPDDLEPNG